MSDILSQVVKFRNYSKSVATTFQLYYNKLEFTGFSGVEPYLSDTIVKDLKYIINDVKLSKYTANKDFNYADAFDIYFEIMNHYDKLSYIVGVFNNNSVDITKEGSFTSSGTNLTSTYIKDLISMLQDINDIFNKYKSDVNIDLIHIIIANLDLNVKQKQVEEINNIYYEYVTSNTGKYVVELYSHLLQEIILNTSDKEIIKYVNKTVESLKSQILESDYTVLSQNKANNTIQNLMQMHNLTPTGVSMPIKDLFDIIGIAAKFKDMPTFLKNVCSIASKDTQKFGIIVITKVIKNPLEYNFWTLTNLKYLQTAGLLQDPLLGLNAIGIQRTTTMIPKTVVNNIKDSVEIYNADFSKTTELNFYYVIETIDGENYRFLTPWNMDSYHPIYYMPASWIENLNSKKFSPSKRLENYNHILNENIIAHLTKPITTMEFMNRDEVQKEESYWRSLRSRIKILIVNDFTDIFVDTFVEKGNKITTSSITNLFLDERIYKSALNHITENIQLDSISNLNNQVKTETIKQIQMELTISYFYDLSYIQRSLKRDIDNIYKKDYANKIDRLISDNKLSVKNKVVEMYDQILTEILEKFINKKSGIYLSIQKKFDILSKTVLAQTA